MTGNGDIEKADLILTPNRIAPGKYEVSVTRKGQDLYKIDGQNIFIATRYCYEYAYSEDVILIIESNIGYTIGKIIF